MKEQLVRVFKINLKNLECIYITTIEYTFLSYLKDFFIIPATSGLNKL